MSESLYEFDLIVMGAGISGLGVAMAAVEKGYKVCIVDKNKVSRATSNNSLRIIHGGLRYLQKFDFKRVYESACDQSYCLKKFSSHIKPLNCVLPLSGKGLKRSFLVKIAAALYSVILLLSRSSIKAPKVTSSIGTDLESVFKSVKRKSFLSWYDGLVSNPVELGEILKSEILSKGGKVLENTSCLSFSDSDDAVTLVMADNVNEVQFTYCSKYLINCLGPQVSYFYKGFDCKWALAFNVILNRTFHSETAFACDGSAGRNFFFVPRDGQTVLGTDYLELGDYHMAEVPSEEKVSDFLQAASTAMPSLQLKMSDISGIEWGVLPVKGFKSASNPDFFGSSKVQRKGRVVHVLSTKYTGFRSQALRVLRLLDI